MATEGIAPARKSSLECKERERNQRTVEAKQAIANKRFVSLKNNGRQCTRDHSNDADCCVDPGIEEKAGQNDQACQRVVLKDDLAHTAECPVDETQDSMILHCSTRTGILPTLDKIDPAFRFTLRIESIDVPSAVHAPAHR